LLDRCQILNAILVKVPYGEIDWHRNQELQLLLERAVSVPQQNADVLRFEIGKSKVDVATIREVGRDYAVGLTG
jgi:hypothetical protein